MAGEGEKLRVAREKKAWSLLNAEEATKIRARYLEALEAEKYETIPGTAYVKGFLQTYAKHLDLNPGEVLALFKSSQVSEKIPAISMPLTSIRPLWWRPAVAVVMALLAISAVVAIAHWSQPPSQVPYAYTPAPLPSAPKPNNSKETEPSSTPSISPNSPTSSPTPTNTINIPMTEGLIAQLVFSQPCWLVVKTDGQSALEETFSAGTTKELKASSKIELVTVGNAGGISITLNGTVLPGLGNSGQVVRNIVLTKDTLSAK